MPAVIGTDAANSEIVEIADTDRAAGLYLLGKPRTGKSWLLVNLIRQDIQEGRGVFFIDPHGDAIDDPFTRYPALIEFPKVLLIDPEEERQTVGVNPLRCKELSSLQERSIAFKRTKGLFDKLWKKTFEERPWLQLILQTRFMLSSRIRAIRLLSFHCFLQTPPSGFSFVRTLPITHR